MGCDYYTWIETIIQWKDLSGNLVHYVDKPEFQKYDRRYCWRREVYDPDFEDEPEDELDLEIREYGKKVLFSEGKWLCKEAGKQRILDILAERGVPVERLQYVCKKMNGYWR